MKTFFQNPKHRGLKIAVSLFAIILIVWWMSSCGSGQGTGQSEEEIKVKKGNLTVAVTTTGEVKPQNRLEVKPPVAGRIDEVLVREGDEVKKGDILAWMSSTDRVVLLDAMILQKKKETSTDWEEVYKPTPLLAPIAGTVIVRNAEPGQTVTTTDVVLVLADRLIVKAQIDETDVGKVKVGQKATIVLDAYPDEKVTAAVDHIAYESKTVSNVTIYEADVLPDHVPPHFVSGMTADVNIEVAKREGVVLVPMTAVEEKNGEKHVWVLGENGQPSVLKTIKTGVSDGTNYEVLKELKEGDVVIVKKRTPGKQTGKKRTVFGPP